MQIKSKGGYKMKNTVKDGIANKVMQVLDDEGLELKEKRRVLGSVYIKICQEIKKQPEEKD